MITLTGSVGRKGDNHSQDVQIVQEALNKLHEILGLPPIRTDGTVDDATIAMIEAFQRHAGTMRHPDGRIDPEGQTVAALRMRVRRPQIESAQPLSFPLRVQPLADYHTHPRNFGANRSGGRQHAACDLYAEVGTEILAMADGTVLRGPYPFYLGTHALEVDHGDFVARYGEISHAAEGLGPGSPVTRGQVIAYVGKLEGLANAMLHLEMYQGTEVGPLTQRDHAPYQRRADLMDPTPYLDEAARL